MKIEIKVEDTEMNGKEKIYFEILKKWKFNKNLFYGVLTNRGNNNAIKYKINGKVNGVTRLYTYLMRATENKGEKNLKIYQLSLKFILFIFVGNSRQKRRLPIILSYLIIYKSSEPYPFNLSLYL